MLENATLELALIVAAGVVAQWSASLLKLPSIVLMLLAGLTLGPFLGLVNPDELLGPLLEPSISLAVALILFEGALSIRFGQIEGVESVVWRLVTVGTVVTWGVGVGGILLLADLDWRVAVLAAAILVVSGPTVVGPMLRQLRPRRPTSSILRWESILIDPLGAMLAVVVLEAVVVGSGNTVGSGVLQVGRFLLLGSLIGLAGAAALIPLLRRHWVPDYLQPGVTLIMTLGVFVGANQVEAEAGLLAVTVAGVALANQPWVGFGHIVEFKENLRVLLISSVFVILAARLEVDALQSVIWPALGVTAVLILVARPMAVAVSTVRSGLEPRDRWFLTALAPRGVVAALVATVFMSDLAEAGIDGSELGPMVFLVIGFTSLIYGVAAPWMGRGVGVADSDPQGVLVLGAGPVETAVGGALRGAGVHVIVAATNRSDQYTARMDGFETFYGDVLAEDAIDRIDLHGIGHLLALTPNHEYNSLALIRFRPVFGRDRVFQLTGRQDLGGEKTAVAAGRVLFSEAMTYDELHRRLESGASIKVTSITEEFSFSDYCESRPDAEPLFLVSDGQLSVFSEDGGPTPAAGDQILALVSPGEEAGSS